jgi:hypothetical protein
MRNVCAFLLTAVSIAPLESKAGPTIRLSHIDAIRLQAIPSA